MQLRLDGALAVERIADAAIKAGQAVTQIVVCGALAGGRVEGHDRGKAFGAIGLEEAVVEAGVKFLDPHLGYRPIAAQGPGLALLQRCGEPPADPLHWLRQLQQLRVKQPPGPAGVGGVDDHRRAGRHGGL